MPEKISILKESGETLVSNIVSVFTIPETEKRYIITTENAVDPHGLTVLHVSEIVNGNLQKVATDDEWSSIKTIMRAIISGNVGSYKYLPPIQSANANGQYSRDISVSASASKQMIDNYNAGDKSGNEGGAALGEETLPTNELETPSPVVASSIFPTDGTTVSNDDELVPGIAELGNEATPMPAGGPVTNGGTDVSLTPVMPTPINNDVNGISPNLNINGAVMPDNGLVNNPMMPQNGGGSAMGMNTVPVVGQPMIPMGNGMNAEISPVPIDSVMPLVGEMPNNTQLNPMPTPMMSPNTNSIPPIMGNNGMDLGTNLTSPLNPLMSNDVQVAMPTAIVPDAQIAQGVPTPINNELLGQSSLSSFAPNASLGEVVNGAQQMFMEGVKNLVQTIQEKVYRDLYTKEAELKNREALIEQRERALNSQMTVAIPQMPSNINMPIMEPTPVVVPTVSVAQPIVQPVSQPVGNPQTPPIVMPSDPTIPQINNNDVI